MESSLSPGWITLIVLVILICLAGFSLGIWSIFPVIRRHYHHSRMAPNAGQDVEAGPSNKPSAPIEEAGPMDAGHQNLNVPE